MNNYTIMQNNIQQNHIQMKPYPYPVYGQNIILLRTIGQCLKESLQQYEMYLKQNVTAVAEKAQKQLQKANHLHTHPPNNFNQQLTVGKQLNQPHVINQKNINDKLSKVDINKPKNNKNKNIEKKPHISSPTLTDDQPFQQQKFETKTSKKRQLRSPFSDESIVKQKAPEPQFPLVSLLDACALPTFGMTIQQKCVKKEGLLGREVGNWTQKIKKPKVKREIRMLESLIAW